LLELSAGSPAPDVRVLIVQEPAAFR